MFPLFVISAVLVDEFVEEAINSIPFSRALISDGFLDYYIGVIRTNLTFGGPNDDFDMLEVLQALFGDVVGRVATRLTNVTEDRECVLRVVRSHINNGQVRIIAQMFQNIRKAVAALKRVFEYSYNYETRLVELAFESRQGAVPMSVRL